MRRIAFLLPLALAAAACSSEATPGSAATVAPPDGTRGVAGAASNEAPGRPAGEVADQLATSYLTGQAGAGGQQGQVAPPPSVQADGGPTQPQATVGAPPVAGAPDCADAAYPAPLSSFATAGTYVCDAVAPCAGGVRSPEWCDPRPWTNGVQLELRDPVQLDPAAIWTRVLVHGTSVPPLAFSAPAAGVRAVRIRAPSSWSKPANWTLPPGTRYGAATDLDRSAWSSGGHDCMIWFFGDASFGSIAQPGQLLVDLSNGGVARPPEQAGWVEVTVAKDGDLIPEPACP